MKYALLFILMPILMAACSRKQDELVCFHAVMDDYSEKITVNGTIQAVNTTYLKAPPMFLCTIIWLEEEGKFVRKGDTVCILEHPDISLQQEAMLEELKKMEAQLEKLEADHQVNLAMLQAEIENNNIQLSINSLDSIQKRFAPPLQQKLIALNQQKAEIQREKLEKKYASRKTIGETEIRGLKSRIKQMENQIDRIHDELDQLIITAPIDGILIHVEMPRLYFMSSTGSGSLGGKIVEGSSTWTNMNILEIPEMDSMQVLAELSENNYKKVEEGQKVILKVEAKNNLMTSGVIKRKMLTGKQIRWDSKVKTYEALVEIDSCHRQLTPGMNAECEIFINQIRDALVVPAVAVFEENDTKYVYIREDRRYKKTPVETGFVNSTYCVITGGLPPDTYIALTRPPAGKIIRIKGKTAGPETEHADSVQQVVPGTDSMHLTNQI